ncbi:MAG TPA: hypothetical protein VFB35_06890 [Gaiellaceae bacterium]|nr:hypothetical protein [Gaiellaceae bacterium]
MSDTHAEPRSSHGRWFYARRLKIALGIAVLEGIFVAFANDFSQWTVIIISVPIIAFYIFAGRNVNSDTGRQLSWIAAASQAFTVILCVLAKLIGKTSLIVVGIFAVIAVILLIGEKPGKTADKR